MPWSHPIIIVDELWVDIEVFIIVVIVLRFVMIEVCENGSGIDRFVDEGCIVGMIRIRIGVKEGRVEE